MSKAVRKAKRSAKTASERRATKNEVETGFVNAMSAAGFTPKEMYKSAFNVLDSIGEYMKRNGIERDKFVREYVGANKVDSDKFVYCRRCAIRKKVDGRWVCPDTFVGPMRQPFEFDHGDGCTRGYPGEAQE